ncbi:fibronectin type III domain-containing protein [Streptomyces sp. NPDC026206]|uniref:fibronectin type III domain-containing protein n=1 Tax=Streptomyces sp. NPDC026206 TaxID=3157089 RepID=UPI0033E6601E
MQVNGGAWRPIDLPDSTATSVPLTGVDPGSTVYYAVRARDQQHYSAWSFLEPRLSECTWAEDAS